MKGPSSDLLAVNDYSAAYRASLMPRSGAGGFAHTGKWLDRTFSESNAFGIPCWLHQLDNAILRYADDQTSSMWPERLLHAATPGHDLSLGMDYLVRCSLVRLSKLHKAKVAACPASMRTAADRIIGNLDVMASKLILPAGKGGEAVAEWPGALEAELNWIIPDLVKEGHVGMDGQSRYSLSLEMAIKAVGAAAVFKWIPNQIKGDTYPESSLLMERFYHIRSLEHRSLFEGGAEPYDMARQVAMIVTDILELFQWKKGESA